jgi:ribosomal protein S17
MTTDSSSKSLLNPSLRLCPLFAVLMLGACSSPKPPPPPVVVTRISPGAPSEESNYGAEVVVNSSTAKATVVAINSLDYEIVLRRSDGRTVKCKARGGIKDFRNLKVGDEVTIAIGEERALALGKTALPDSSPNSDRLNVRLPQDTVALADTVETVTFTAKILAIDQWNRIVTLQMADGSRKSVQTTPAVNLADFSRGDEVSVRITEVIVLVVEAAKQ